MNWYELLALFLGGGGVIYLIVEKVLNHRRDSIENASSIASLYKEIDGIVQSKTAPIEEKLDKALVELDGLKEWRCYKKDCPKRALKSDTKDGEL